MRDIHDKGAGRDRNGTLTVDAYIVRVWERCLETFSFFFFKVGILFGGTEVKNDNAMKDTAPGRGKVKGQKRVQNNIKPSGYASDFFFFFFGESVPLAAAAALASFLAFFLAFFSSSVS